ncbi:MAG TPA: 4-(cytidine 5'-diphospho)-2-C-methyl-D-erythritol kinase [Jatrophihabitantaceae bacterium]
MPPADPPAFRVRAPAKVNLHLGVGPLRRDGYHDLVTVFHAVDLTDDVVARPADRLELVVTGEGAAGLPTDERNLAWRAAALLAEHAGVPARARLEITKSIPVAGGMAGGSADAAAALVACAALWHVEAPLAELAARLGSDVAFPLSGGTALGTGRGEVLSPVLTGGAFHWVFALADHGISAGDAYRELDRQRSTGAAPRPVGSPDAVIEALRSGDPHRLAGTLANDLQPAALAIAPALRRTLVAGHELGAIAAIVSGSGPTCAFLTAGRAEATALAAALAAEGICRTTRVASGPAPGAMIVP